MSLLVVRPVLLLIINCSLIIIVAAGWPCSFRVLIATGAAWFLAFFNVL